MPNRNVSMPDPPVPTGGVARMADTGADRENYMVDIDFGPCTILEEKEMDPYTPGTRGDETGIGAELIRKVKNQEY